MPKKRRYRLKGLSEQVTHRKTAPTPNTRERISIKVAQTASLCIRREHKSLDYIYDHPKSLNGAIL